MNKKLENARENLIKSAKELDKVSRCHYAKEGTMVAIVKAMLKKFYRY